MPSTGDQLEPNSIRSEHTLSYGPERRRAKCVQPPHLQILCRVVERVMQTIAEAAWLLQSNRWAFGIFGPRYFSAKSFGAQGWGPVRRGVGGRSGRRGPHCW